MCELGWDSQDDVLACKGDLSSVPVDDVPCVLVDLLWGEVITMEDTSTSWMMLPSAVDIEGPLHQCLSANSCAHKAIVHYCREIAQL